MIVLGYMASKYMPLQLNLSCLGLLFVAIEYHLLLSEMLKFFKSKLVHASLYMMNLFECAVPTLFPI